MIYNVTYGFEGMSQGWSESHACLAAASNPADVLPTALGIAVKRVQMLGREFSITHVKVARYATEAGVRQKGSRLKKQIITNSVTTVGAAAEPAVVALIVDGFAANTPGSPFNANKNRTYFGAPLDVCVDSGGEVFKGKGGLDAAFASWRSAMLNSAVTWGWLASDLLIDVPISSITASTSGRVVITTEENVQPTLTSGQRYRARIRGVNNGRSPLNGELIVSCNGVAQLTSQQLIGFATDQAGGSIKVYRPVSPFVAYGDLQLQDFSGKHTRGLPFGSRRGRRKNRVRG